MPYEQYETVIGLEVHVQLATHSKAFCGDDASFGGEPNTHISTISLGHPGTLPRLNKQQIEFAVRLGFALNSDINLISTFDRKNYFYADLPKGYQITQDKNPICIGGWLEISDENKLKKIRIHHVHMEEDAGKSMHDADPKDSLIDLNRAGVPLLEIVTEPDLRSADEVDAFMTAMRQLVRYLGISDGNMEEGSMRCDCNVSVRKKGETKLNNRCEIKNVNSMRFARRAIEYEVKRQIDIMEMGGMVEQQTLNFDPETGVTAPLRSKEDAQDYRYFPEPDLPPVIITPAYLENVKLNLVSLPWALRERLINEFSLPEYDINLLTEEKTTALFFLEFAKYDTNYKAISNLIINKILPWCQDQKLEIGKFPVGFKQLAAFIKLIDEGKVSNSNAYQRIFPQLTEQPERSPLEIAQALNLIQTSDEDFLEKIVDEVLAKNPTKVIEYQKGKKGLLGFFVGEVMRQSKGKAEPKMTNALLIKKLGN
ncbi:MAG: Asp-tRNA(Asn)/Glu-tRNA(Gln) amidotransferase subunit GatB [Saprospiraceae bacterium]|nr:Asp-tRNA(Asn)/Glu-tRNA(Gln) amidotransferase subunit GatB [Saprospiraceae bacterium]